MKCETCAKGEAMVAYTHIVDDTKKTLFLCEVCAEEKNIETAASSEDKTKDVPVLVQEVKEELTNLAGAEDAGSASCQACGMAYDEFKKAGRLGCSECYGAFATIRTPSQTHPRCREAPGQGADRGSVGTSAQTTIDR